MHGFGQRGVVRHLLQNVEIDQPNFWRFEPFDFRGHEWHHVLLAISGSIERGFEKVSGELGAVPEIALFYGWFRAAHVERVATIQIVVRSGTRLANVGRKEHDVRRGSETREIPHRLCFIPRPHVDQRSRRTTFQRQKQKLVLLCRMDPEQRQIVHLRYPTERFENVRHFYREHDCDSGNVQESWRGLFVHV